LHALLRDRGERVERVVISVPATTRPAGAATELGNRVGVIPVELPTGGDPVQRLSAIAGITRTRRRAPRAASAALLGPVFRTLGRLGLFAPFINRQRMITTFVTNVRGPESRLSLLGAPISDVYPVAVVPGNVTVAFAALSYAGTLSITVTADPDHCPDLPALERHLRRELEVVTAARVAS
jgi:diacylglycerol O-acyltransferase / wax synthase